MGAAGFWMGGPGLLRQTLPTFSHDLPVLYSLTLPCVLWLFLPSGSRAWWSDYQQNELERKEVAAAGRKWGRTGVRGRKKTFILPPFSLHSFPSERVCRATGACSVLCSLNARSECLSLMSLLDLINLVAASAAHRACVLGIKVRFRMPRTTHFLTGQTMLFHQVLRMARIKTAEITFENGAICCSSKRASLEKFGY